MLKKIRVRFAPSPTGFLHLGNIRAALLNYIFARQSGGKFILRIEDTDASRNVDEAGLQIIKDLKWLGLNIDEGATIGGAFGPYLQSERVDIYEKHLLDLIENRKVYRCFCSAEDLEQKRMKQIEHGKPPRYDGTCAQLSDDKVKQKLVAGLKFIWRLRINPDQVIKINDMARGDVEFEMKNFSDFGLTRPDGTFTFMFANFIDDWLMQITHVIRGEDHLTNSAMQAVLFDSFAVKLPAFWHLPMICNVDGKKLSKRDFGFSLNDLRKDGFLPEAICNYLAIIGVTFKEEIQSLNELVKSYDFSNINSTGSIKFDVDKLLWINHEWINKIKFDDLFLRVKPFLDDRFSNVNDVSEEILKNLVNKIYAEAKTLNDIVNSLEFYFEKPKVSLVELEEKFGKDVISTILILIKSNLSDLNNPKLFLEKIKSNAKKDAVKIGSLFQFVRYALTGSFHGIGINDLFDMLSVDEIKKRFESL